MKILYIGNADSVFLYETVRRVKAQRPDYRIDILNVSPRKNDNDYSALGVNISQIGGSRLLAVRLLRGLTLAHLIKQSLRFLPDDYDYVHLEYITPWLGLAAATLKRKGSLICSFWGSELLCGTRLHALLQRRLIHSAYRVTLYTEQMRRIFTRKFGSEYNGKVCNIGFGTNALDEIDELESAGGAAEAKRRMNVPADKILVVCGGNATASQQHKMILQAACGLDEAIRNRMYFIMQMSYGASPHYLDRIKNAFAASGLQGRVLTGFMDWRGVASLRLAADIFVFMQKADGFSSALREHLYAGSVPIIGSWLRYEALSGSAYYRTASTPRELAGALAAVADNLAAEKRLCLANRALISECYTWNSVAEKLVCLYERHGQL